VMSEIDDEEVIKFMEKNYPQYKDNIVLGRLLYAKYTGRIVPSDRHEYDEVKISKIGEELEGAHVKFRGIIATAERYEYLACPKCLKKNCSCGVPDEQKIRRLRIRGVVGDETDCVDYTYFVGLDANLEVGKEYMVYAYVKKQYDGDGNVVYVAGKPVYEVIIQRVEPIENNAVKDKDVEQIIEFVRRAKKVKVDIVKNMCRKFGVDFEKLRLKEVDGYVVWE
jgi:hypothetical protein